MKRRLLCFFIALAVVIQCATAFAWPRPMLRKGNITGGGSSLSWATWDEKTESGWGDSSVNITIFDGGDSTNETGQGAVSGANLVWTQSGAIGAAVSDGGYYYRPMDGTNDSFKGTAGWWDGIFAGQAQWFLGLKVQLLRAVGGTFVFDWEGTNAYIRCSYAADGVLSVTVDDADLGAETQAVTDAIPINTTVWICVWTGPTFTRIGWKTGAHPTKWSDFEGTKRTSFAGKYDNFAATNAAIREIFYAGGAVYQQGRIYAVVAAKGKTLIDDNN